MKAGFLLVVALFGIANVFGRIIHHKNLQSQLDELIENVENLEEEIENEFPKNYVRSVAADEDENTIDERTGGSDIVERPDENNNNRKRAANDNYWKWPKNPSTNIVEILYDFSPAYQGDSTSRGKVESAITKLNEKLDGCVQWIPRDPVVHGTTHYARFEDSTGCRSYVGRVTGHTNSSVNGDSKPVGFQPVWLLRRKEYENGLYSTCLKDGIIQHEMLHLMGFYHEQSRPDRDEYVRINWDNIKEGSKGNFDKKDDSQTFNHPYDYGSVMHYGRTSFAINRTIDTITPINPETATIGQRDGISPGDIQDVFSYYECPQTEPTTTTTTTESTTTTTTTESTTEATTQSTTESTTQSTTEATTQSTTESTTQSTTEATTQSTTEATTESTTEATTESTTEATTESTTEATTQSTTEATTEPPTTETPSSDTILVSQDFTLSEDNKIRARGMRYVDRCNDEYRRCSKVDSELQDLDVSVCDRLDDVCQKYCGLCDIGVDRYATLQGKEGMNGQIWLQYNARDENDQCAETPREFTTCMAFNVRRSSEHDQIDAEFYGQYSAGKDENGDRVYGYTNEKYQIPKDYMMDEWFSVYGEFKDFACRKGNQFFVDISPGAKGSIDIDDVILFDGYCADYFGSDAGHQDGEHGFEVDE